MGRFGGNAMVAAVLTFCVFFSNVALGAFADAAFLTDISEMLVLFVAVIFFVIAILAHEKNASENQDNQ